MTKNLWIKEVFELDGDITLISLLQVEVERYGRPSWQNISGMIISRRRPCLANSSWKSKQIFCNSGLRFKILESLNIFIYVFDNALIQLIFPYMNTMSITHCFQKYVAMHRLWVFSPDISAPQCLKAVDRSSWIHPEGIWLCYWHPVCLMGPGQK